MSERLPELLRQRALIQEHLAWLDREIAAAQGLPTPPRPVATSPLTAPAPTTIHAPLGISSKIDDEAATIIGQYQKDPNVLKTDTKRGCLVAFGIGFGLFAVIAFIAYWLYARHLGRWW
jgi:hypothetical protein